MERQHEATLSGKVAIVTGSSRGTGKRTAIALARRVFFAQRELAALGLGTDHNTGA